MPLATIPPARKVLREALLAQSAVTGSAVGSRIYYGLPAVPTYPLIVLTTIDEVPDRPENNFARVQLDIWGRGVSVDNQLECEDLAALIATVARDLSGDWPTGKLRNTLATSKLPSPDTTGRARVIQDIETEVYP